VDLQKAFDTVNHEILLCKLNYYGFRGIINDWFRSYLYERKQKVCINGYESETKTLQHGVPQGSVLGPILFLLYINDLHKCINYSITYHFADDTNLLNISDNYKILQKNVNKDLNSLNNWLLSNKISLNKDKTELIFFRKVRSKLPLNIKCGRMKNITPETINKDLSQKQQLTVNSYESYFDTFIVYFSLF